MTSIPRDNSLQFGLAAVCLWSTVATALKLSLSYLSPLELLWVAALSSWCFLAVFVLVSGEWREWQSIAPRKLSLAVLVGLLNPTLYYLMLLAAYDRLPAQEAMAINYSWALTLALLAAPVLGQRIAIGQWLAAGVSYLGILLIATRGDLLNLNFADPIGVGLAVASTLVWSAYWLINTKLPLPAVSGLLLNFTGGVLATTALLLASSPRSLPLDGVAGGIYVGLMEMGASYVLWLTAMRRTRNTLKISTLIFLSPPLSLVLIWLVLGEPIRGATLVGLVLILAGLAMQQFQGRRRAASA